MPSDPDGDVGGELVRKLLGMSAVEALIDLVVVLPDAEREEDGLLRFGGGEVVREIVEGEFHRRCQEGVKFVF